MSDRFEIHRLSGYTDGNPSWSKVLVPSSATYLRHSIEAEMERLKAAHPKSTFRIRKSRKKR